MGPLIAAHLFARDDGTTSVAGFNFANSVDSQTIRQSAWIRSALGLEQDVRFEHHVTETYRSIVRQPYLRRDQLTELAAEIPNISAKHEGGDPIDEETRLHPSDILDYFVAKVELEESGDIDAMEQNYIDKHIAMNRTAQALVAAGVGVNDPHRAPITPLWAAPHPIPRRRAQTCSTISL